MIYPIYDNSWVSPMYVVLEKGCMIVFRNEKNELIKTRTVTGWRMCIDYYKDNFPLSFMDQMLEKITCQSYYCFLDGYL